MKRILYLQYFDPAAYPPLDRSASQFLERGCTVRFLGVRSQGEDAEMRLSAHPRLTERLISKATTKATIGAYFAAAVEELVRFRPDVVYCSQERVYPIGLAASFLPHVKTVLHEHDTPWLDAGRKRSLLVKARAAFARRATLCVIPQTERAIRFAAETGARRVAVAYNTPALSEIGPPPPLRTGPGLVLWHHGSIGPRRLPASLIHALAKTPDDVVLRVAGYETISTRGYVDSLKALAGSLGIGHRFSYLGAAKRDDLYAAARAADVGVLLFDSNFIEPMAGASNKPFDFLACGLPLITNDTTEWRDFFGDRNVSLSCRPDDPDDIARVIMWYRDHPEERASMAQRGHQAMLDEWNYEQSFAPVLEALEAPSGIGSRT